MPGARHCGICSSTDHDRRRCTLPGGGRFVAPVDPAAHVANLLAGLAIGGGGGGGGGGSAAAAPAAAAPAAAAPAAPAAAALAPAAAAGEGVDDDSFECGICFSEYEQPVTTPCGHSYCHGCLRNWLRATPLGATCPACRAAIPRAAPAVNLELRRALERVARASPPPPLPLIPEAELVEGALLGQGGFGTVHRAFWHALPVALKSLRLEAGDATDAARRAFEREMQVLFHLRHPNIVPVFGVCHHSDSRVSLVEALAERGDLHALLHPPGSGGGGGAPLPAATALRMGLDVARGLAHAHSKGVVHMDVKPANVLRGEGDRLMLADFGLAQRVRSSLPHTHTHSMQQSSAGGGGGSGGHGWAGTVCYAAPEALSGSEGSAAYGQPPCDVFSLGVVLWELCSGGQAPWRDKNLLQVIRAVDRGERPALPAGVHAGLGALIARCWAQAPGDRPTASDVVVQLAALLAGLAPPAQGGGGGGGGP